MCSLSLPCFLFPTDSGSSHSPGLASRAWMFDWLVCVPWWSHHAITNAVCKNGSDSCVIHYVLPLRSKPSQLTQHCFHFSVEACCRNGSDACVIHNILPLPSKPHQLTQHCFHLSLEACCKPQCDTLIHVFTVVYRMHDHSQLLPQNKPPHPHSEDCTEPLI